MEDLVADTAFKERIAHYSLSELEDVLAHVDRDAFPEREQWVRNEIEARLASVDVSDLGMDTNDKNTPPSFLKRWGVGLIDLSIQVMIPYIILYFIVKVIYTPLGNHWLIQYLFPPNQPQSGGRGRGRGRGGNDIGSDIAGLWDSFYGFVTGIVTGTPEALATLGVVGKYFLVYLIFRLVWTSWRLRKFGATSGMKEMGVQLESHNGGPLSSFQIVARFVVQHFLFIITLGVSGLWMFWDREKRALHDKVLGTRLVRVDRSWEKSIEARKFD